MITILSVVYKSYPYFQLNYKLTNQQNKNFQWIVCQNDNNNSYKEFEKVQIIPGISRKELYKQCRDLTKVRWNHHGKALQKIIPLARSRFVLILDPDFYMFFPFTQIIQYMKEKNLAAFGAPYAKNGPDNIPQNVPVGFCLFIDQKYVKIKKFDWSNLEPNPGGEFYHFCQNKLSYEYIPSFPLHTEQKLEFLPDNQIDQYFWKNKLFGLHCHMQIEKMSHRLTRKINPKKKYLRKMNLAFKNKIDDRLKFIKQIYELHSNANI